MFCGGILIFNIWVVTVVYCFVYYLSEFKCLFVKFNIDVILGMNQCKGKDGVKRKIKWYIIYLKFVERFSYDNDIVFIEMDEVVNFIEKIQLLCLKFISIIDDLFLFWCGGRRVGCVIGCGQRYENIEDIFDFIYDVYVFIIFCEICIGVNIGIGNFMDIMFCVGYECVFFGDVCYGDSGGLLSV